VTTIRELHVTFHGTDCEVLHNKVYSLLSLASDGNTIPVDYGCPPQNLLYNVIILDGWSDDELWLLAKDLGIFELVPCRFHGYKDSTDLGESEQSPIDVSLVVTHRIRFCSIPLTLDELDQRRWAAVIEAGPAEPCQNLTGVFDLSRFTELCDLYPEEQDSCRGIDNEDCNEGKFCKRQSEFNSLNGAIRIGESRLLTCDDGSTGLACLMARAGDLLCDFVPGRKLVVRQDRHSALHLIGTATLSRSFPLNDILLAQVRKMLELALQEQQYNDFLQVDCSVDGSKPF
jgi:hypothetical protein